MWDPTDWPLQPDADRTQQALGPQRKVLKLKGKANRESSLKVSTIYCLASKTKTFRLVRSKYVILASRGRKRGPPRDERPGFPIAVSEKGLVFIVGVWVGGWWGGV